MVRSVRSPKILDRHRDRLAIVYVRQSTPQQVLERTESRARQYDLAAHAVALGWLADQDGVYNPMDTNDRLLLGLK